MLLEFAVSVPVNGVEALGDGRTGFRELFVVHQDGLWGAALLQGLVDGGAGGGRGKEGHAVPVLHVHLQQVVHLAFDVLDLKQDLTTNKITNSI